MTTLHLKQAKIKHNNQLLVSHFNFCLSPGEVWGILGQNGCGKTTLLHTLAGLHALEQGEIYLDKHLLKSLRVKSVAQTIGLLFQEVKFNFSQTIWDYCLAGRYPHLAYFQKEDEKDREIVRQSLQTMGLHHLLHRQVTSLSGGEKRKVAMAALLTQTPQIYLLDEPVNHLDIKHQIEALHHFRKLAKEMSASIVMSLHDINLAQQFCDFILLMFPEGKILQGRACEMLTSEHLTQVYQHPIVSINTNGSILWQPTFL